jgi:hypothetical protein
MHNSNKTLIIVPCGKKKIWDKTPSASPTPARHAYTSNYFKLCVQYAEKFLDKWVIFSGKYGLISPYFIIDNYDTKVKVTNGFRNKVKEQLEPFISSGCSSFISLCGQEYSKILRDIVEPIDLKLYTPLEGLRIGIRQKRIKDCLEHNIPL